MLLKTNFLSFFKKLKLKHWIILTASIVFLAVALPIVLLVIPFPLPWKIKSITAMPSNVVYDDTTDTTPFLYKTNSDGSYSDEPFKILTFTDTHFEAKFVSYIKNINTIKYMKKNIEEVKPDLVVITGDIVTSMFTQNRLKGLADMMEAYQIYWAPVYGNHDGEVKMSVPREEITKFWSSYKYCLVHDTDSTKDRSGNYIINIKTAPDKVSQSLVFIDSGKYITEEEKALYNITKTHYAFIQHSQVDWYKRSMTEIKNQYGDVKSLLFLHIPLPEYNDAYEHGEILSGNKREIICSPGYNSGMFAAIKEIGSTQAVFCGHDHTNDFDALYEGVRFIYLQKSGYASYHNGLQGANLIIVNNDGAFENLPLLNSRFK